MAITSVSQFQANVADIARPYSFKATFSGEGFPGLDGNKVTATLRTATFPGLTVTPVEIPYFGINYKIAGSPTYEPVTATFLIDAAYSSLSSWYGILDRIFTFEWRVLNMSRFVVDVTDMRIDL